MYLHWKGSYLEGKNLNSQEKQGQCGERCGERKRPKVKNVIVKLKPKELWLSEVYQHSVRFGQQTFFFRIVKVKPVLKELIEIDLGRLKFQRRNCLHKIRD